MEQTEIEALKVRMRGPHRQGVDAPEILAGKIFLDLRELFCQNFQDTALVRGAEITSQDLEAVKKAQREAVRINPWIFNSGTQETNFLVARYARVLGGLFNKNGYNLNLNELEVRAHLHDVGRANTHRRRVNDLRGNEFLRYAGVDSTFLANMPSDNHWWPVDAASRPAYRVEAIDKEATMARYADTSDYVRIPEKSVVEWSDIMGKYKEGRLLRASELEEFSLRGKLTPPDPSKTGPMEYVRMTSAFQNIDGVVEFYNNLGTALEQQTGVSMEDLVDIVGESIAKHPLPRTYHQELGKLPFSNVVWDLGGVVFKGGATESNDPLYNPVIEAYGFEDPAQVRQLTGALELLIRECGVRPYDEQVAVEMAKIFGKPFREFSMAKILSADASSYNLDLDTVRMMVFLRNEGVRTIIASNTEQNGFPLMLGKLQAVDVATGVIETGSIDEQRSRIIEVGSERSIPAFASYLNGVRKGGYSIRDDGRGFYEVIRDVADLGPGVLIVDDKPNYTQEGVKAIRGGIPYVWKSAADFERWVVSQFS